MRPVFLLLFSAAAAFGGPFAFGVKGGVPLTDFVNATSNGNFSSYTSTTNPYIIGPMIELNLPFGLGVEFDALYRHYNVQSTQLPVGATTGAWEFPLVAKYRLPTPLVHPYVEGGLSVNRLSGFEQIVSGVLPSSPSLSLPQPVDQTTTGFVLGAGIDIHLLILHISPEIRYTRWGVQRFLGPNGGFAGDRNQAEFLVGITF